MEEIQQFAYLMLMYCNLWFSLHSPPTPVQEVTKYIVYDNCLIHLFSDCPICGKTCKVQRYVMGTFLTVRQSCLYCDFARKWNSQPIIGSTPAGNLHLAAAINFTGSSFQQFNKVNLLLQLTMKSVALLMLVLSLQIQFAHL